MPKGTVSTSPSVMDLFAECDSCDSRDFEQLGSELICTECGMAYVAVEPPVAAPATATPAEPAAAKDAARAA